MTPKQPNYDVPYRISVGHKDVANFTGLQCEAVEARILDTSRLTLEQIKSMFGKATRFCNAKRIQDAETAIRSLDFTEFLKVTIVVLVDDGKQTIVADYKPHGAWVDQ